MREYQFDLNNIHKRTLKCILNPTNLNASIPDDVGFSYFVDTNEHIEIIDTYVDSYGTYRHIVNNEDGNMVKVYLRVYSPVLKNAVCVAAFAGITIWKVEIDKCEQVKSGDFTIITIEIGIGVGKKHKTNLGYTHYYKFIINDKNGHKLAQSYPIKFTSSSSPLRKMLHFRK